MKSRNERVKKFWLMAGLTLMMGLLVLTTFPCMVHAIEEGAVEREANGELVFQATSEWQYIPKGASVPPGLHIRMDMTTGERMAKLLDKDEGGKGEAEGLTPSVSSSSSSSSEGGALSILGEGQEEIGGGRLRRRRNETAGEESIVILEREIQEEQPEEQEQEGKVGVVMEDKGTLSPHETMEKVLLNLPEPEKESMGINRLHQKRSQLAEEEYWSKVEKIWEERQALLQRAYDNMLKPAEMLGKLIHTISKPSNCTTPELCQALIDLEDHLSDLDMARDFHTMGGWLPLVDLLRPEHESEVRWRAAWALGNAVKNDQDFQHWILEENAGLTGGKTRKADVAGSEEEEEGEKEKRNALEHLIAMLMEGGGGREGEGQKGEDEVLRKAVYAITSAARGNPRVQAHLHSSGGMDAMGKLLHQPQVPSRALRVKLASFGHDLATEAKHLIDAALESAEARASGLDQQGANLISSVTTKPWCQGTLNLLGEVLSDPIETEKVLHALQALHPHCHEDHLPQEDLKKALDTAHSTYAPSSSDSEEDKEKASNMIDIDPIYREELLDLIGGVRRQLDQRAQARQASQRHGHRWEL